MLCLRRAAFRAFTSPCISVPVKSRSLTTLPSSFFRTAPALPRSCVQLQRRFASEEVTDAEPEADGSTEAEHGENSIAESQDGGSAPESVDQENHSTVASAVASAAETASSTVSDVAGSVASTVGLNTEGGLGHIGDIAPSTTLYIGNLFFDVTEDRLKQDFAQFGEISRVRIIYDSRGLSKGFGYVDFVEVSSSTRALQTMNQTNYEGRRLTVQYSLKKKPSDVVTSPNRPTKTLFIGNMSFEMSDQDLNDLFKDIRDVTDVRVAIDRRTGQPRGFAHAEFNTIAGAEKAMSMLENKEVYGRKLRVDFSSTHGSRQPAR